MIFFSNLDHLQGVTISASKLFTVHGNQPHSLILEGQGFELHFPERTFLPDEDCDVMVDVVVGGDFVFPKGVEPVSAIYFISITSKLQKPSLLKIQHCVALNRANKSSQLSFYRAKLKGPKPAIKFTLLEGGRFDVKQQYGVLELPAFCAVMIGKVSSNNSEEDSITDVHNSEGIQLSSSRFIRFILSQTRYMHVLYICMCCIYHRTVLQPTCA